MNPTKPAGIALAAWLLLSACSPESAPAPAAPAPEAIAPEAATPAAPDVSSLPAGAYKLDPLHSSVTFQASHLGFSNYVGQFRSFTADMTFDPAKPGTATLAASIDLSSLSVPAPPTGWIDELLGPQWLGAATTPQLKFESTSVTSTGPSTADIVGNLTMKGTTQPVTLQATFNGGYDGHPQDPHARIGFSAKGVLKRSAFGIDYGIPAPGSTMGVSDEVTFQIEAEFNGPAKA